MRLIVGLLALVLAEIGIRAMDNATTPLPAQLPQRALEKIPYELAGWVGRDLPLDPAIFKHSNAASMLNRAYRNAIGDEIAVNAGIWIDSNIGVPHPPEICYPGAGWEISGRKNLAVRSREGHIQAQLLTFDKSGQRIFVLYWYHFGEHTVVEAGQLRPIRQSLRGSKKPMPPIVKAMLQSGTAEPKIAEQQLLQLASQLVSELAPYNET